MPRLSSSSGLWCKVPHAEATPFMVLAVVLAVVCFPACEVPVGRWRQATTGTDGGKEASVPCGSIPQVGCCSGQSLLYCASGQLKSETCLPPAQCGWSLTYALYICGASSAADPSGKYKLACPTPDGGVDAAADLSTAKDLLPTESGGCGALTYMGCCDKDTVLFCAGGKVLTLSCKSSPQCGWNVKGGYYDCGTDGKGEPSGTYPQSCSMILGDAGLELGGEDGGKEGGLLDAWPDLGPADSTGPDHPGYPKDMVSWDGPGGREQMPPITDAPGPEIIGLDVSGLEAGLSDLRPNNLNGGGCSCQVRSGGQDPARGSVLLLLFALALRLLWVRRQGVVPKLLAGLLSVAAVQAGCTSATPQAGHVRRAAMTQDGTADSDSQVDTVPAEAAPADQRPESAASCGKITAKGCCLGEILYWCEKGTLKSRSCVSAPKCGWTDTQIYDCNTSGSQDPAGRYPQSCALLVGDGSLPGGDGRGEVGPGCGGISREGCCVGNTLKYCSSGVLILLSCALNPWCGWQATGQLYDCGTEGKTDPSGKHTRVCPGTTPGDGPADRTPGEQAADTRHDAGDEGQAGGCACSSRPGQEGGGGAACAAGLLLLALLFRLGPRLRPPPSCRG